MQTSKDLYGDSRDVWRFKVEQEVVMQIQNLKRIMVEIMDFFSDPFFVRTIL